MVFYTSLFLLFLVPCFSFSHLSVFLGVGSSIHVAAWGNQLSVKLLPPLCRKARRAVVAASFCFSWGPKGEAWSGSCSSFWGQLRRKYLGRGGIALSLLVSRALCARFKLWLWKMLAACWHYARLSKLQCTSGQIPWRKSRTWPCSSLFTVPLWTWGKSIPADVSVQGKLISSFVYIKAFIYKTWI